MIIRKTVQSYFWFLVVVTLVACQSPVTPDTAAFTPVVVTQIAPLSDLPTPTISSELTTLPDILPKFPLDEYVVLFIRDGDLYFQDGENIPVKLTHAGESFYYPKLSDDNQKVIFFREDFNKIYSINTDGSQEQIIATTSSLPENRGQNYTQAFIPGTHLLLFNDYDCETGKDKPLCATGLSRVDTDTGEIKELIVPGKPRQYNINSNFNVSPDGKMISVGEQGFINIYDIDGNLIYPNILPYTPSNPTYNHFSVFPVQFWLPDSSGLIVGVPDTSTSAPTFGRVPAYTIWRHTLDSNVTAQISLDPPVMNLFGADVFQVSPDGRWMLYGGNGATPLYIADLSNGHTGIIDGKIYLPYFSWASDSTHFLYSNSIGTIGKSPIRVDGITSKWIDSNHFTYWEALKNVPFANVKILVGEIKGDVILTYDLGFNLPSLVMIKQKK